MSPSQRRLCWLVIVTCVLAAGVAAELADVILKDGTRLRGDVVEAESYIVLRNAAGETRIDRDRVDRIEYIPTPMSVDAEYAHRAGQIPANDIAGHFDLAMWARDKQRYDLVRIQCNFILALDPNHVNARLLLDEARKKLAEQAAAARGEPGGRDAEEDRIEIPPPISARDINRLRMAEIRLDGPAEVLLVRFANKRGEPTIEQLVRREVGPIADTLPPDWEDTLDRGRPHEKLQLIVQTTGLRLADQIEVRGDPQTFDTFRKRVVPLLVRGCARSGCHGGAAADGFRFPRGQQTSDEFVYTTFALLERADTAAGPLLDRSLPERSALLSFMLPASESVVGHPPVARGRLTPVLRNRRDPNYQAVLDWIASLRVPRPDYGLEYEYPAWLKLAPLATEPQLDLGEPAPGDNPPARPATRPAERPAERP